MSQVEQADEWFTLEELAALRKVKVSWLYERSRRNTLPGLRRLGRHVRVVLAEFDKKAAEGALS